MLAMQSPIVTQKTGLRLARCFAAFVPGGQRFDSKYNLSKLAAPWIGKLVYFCHFLANGTT
jgi:hypothetical protein